MPQIRTYEAPQLGLNPTEIGVDATAAAARRVGAAYNQRAAATDELARNTEGLGSFEAGLLNDAGRRIGSTIRDAGQAYLDYQDHQEVSHGAATFAQLTDDLTQKWNDTAKNSDPNDPSVAAKFRETVLEPSLEKYRDGFSTENSQRWAEQHIDALRNHFFQKTSADMSTLAGVAVKNNVTQTGTSMSNTAFTDPSSVPFLLDQADHSIGGIVASSPNLKGADAAKVRAGVTDDVKRSIVQSGMSGAIAKAKDPEAEAQKWIEKYPQYIDGDMAIKAAKAAKVQAKTNTLLDKQTEAYQRQQAENAAHVEANAVYSRNVKINPQTNRPEISPNYFSEALDLVRKYGDAAPNAAQISRTLLDWGEHQQNMKAAATTSDQEVRQDFIDRMFATDNPTTDIQLMRAQVEGKLSKDDFTSMHRLVTTLNESPLKGEVWKDTLAAVKDKLIMSVPGLTGKDGVGIQNYAKFVQEFVPQYLAKSRAGSLEPNALDVKDPNSMISKAMAPYIRSPQDRMRDYVAAAGGVSGQGEKVLSVQTTNLPTVPPPERVVGNTYQTPRGPMKWTGTGWVKP